MNQLAKALVDDATSGEPIPDKGKPQEREKNRAAVELGRLGGLKGGRARADKLTKQQRSDIAKIAAAARWKKKNEQSP